MMSLFLNPFSILTKKCAKDVIKKKDDTTPPPFIDFEHCVKCGVVWVLYWLLILHLRLYLSFSRSEFGKGYDGWFWHGVSQGMVVK